MAEATTSVARRWALMANKDEVVHLGSDSETLESGLDRSKSGSRLVVDPITASRPSPIYLSTRPNRHSTAAPHAEGRAHDGPYVGDVVLGASTPILPSRLSRHESEFPAGARGARSPIGLFARVSHGPRELVQVHVVQSTSDFPIAVCPALGDRSYREEVETGGFV